jgi:hypothetical protein
LEGYGFPGVEQKFPKPPRRTTGLNSTPNGLAVDAGAACVFRRTGSTWAQTAYLQASNTAAEDKLFLKECHRCVGNIHERLKSSCPELPVVLK